MYPFLLEKSDSKNFITNDPSWFVFDVSMKIKPFFMRFKNIPSYYRMLSQSEYSLGKVSNRSFFNNRFSHGWYRVVINKEVIRFIFVLKVKRLERKDQDIFQLIWRSKRLLNSPVLTYSLNELSNTDKILLMNNARVGGFKKILGNRN
jgi:hypothetical protein